MFPSRLPARPLMSQSPMNSFAWGGLLLTPPHPPSQTQTRQHNKLDVLNQTRSEPRTRRVSIMRPRASAGPPSAAQHARICVCVDKSEIIARFPPHFTATLRKKTNKHEEQQQHSRVRHQSRLRGSAVDALNVRRSFAEISG